MWDFNRRSGMLHRLLAWLLMPALAIAQTAPATPPIVTTTTVTPSSPTLKLPGSLNFNAEVTFGTQPYPCCGIPQGNITFAADGTAPNALGSKPLQIVPSTQTIAYAPNQGAAYTFAAAGLPTGLATGAFFADGFTDVAVTDSTDTTPIFFQGTGHSQITRNQNVGVNNGPAGLTAVKGVAAGDFTGNGTTDLVFLGHTNDFTTEDIVYLNQGDDTFDAVISQDGSICNGCSALIPYDVESITVGNFNADKLNDLAYINKPGDFASQTTSGTMGVALNAGQGSFTTFTPIPLPNGSATNQDGFVPNAITSGMFDKNVDLVVAGTYNTTTCTLPGSSGSFNGYIVVYPGDGLGDFGIPQTANGETTYVAPQPICVGENPNAIAVGDFNHDGNLDILVADSGAEEVANASVVLLLGDGKGGFAFNQITSIGTNPDNLVNLLVADFNGDTYPDFAVYDSSGALGFYTNNGAGSTAQFRPLVTWDTLEPGGGGTYSYAAALGDFNADGFPDVATLFVQEPLPVTSPPQPAAGATIWIAADSAFAQAVLTSPAQSLQAGTRIITASFPGDANFAASPSASVGVTVTQTVPTISWKPAPLLYPTPLGVGQLDATANTPLSCCFTYSPGAMFVPPVPASSSSLLPLTASFVPEAPDNFNYAPTTASANVLVSLPPAVATVTTPTMATPGGTPPSIALALDPFPVNVMAKITLTFKPSSANPPTTNGSVQFPNGTAVYSFPINAENTGAIPPVQFSPGTVAGTISVAVTLTTNPGGTDVTPANLATPFSITVPPSVPTFQSVALECGASGVQLIVKGYSLTREISAGQVVFTAAAGQSLQTSSFPINGAQQLFDTYYTGPTSDGGGSSFTLTQPFSFSSGDSSAIASAVVTLTNGQGPAQSSTTQCTPSTD